MLNDIAVRKLIPGNHDSYRRSLSPNSSPRRLRRSAAEAPSASCCPTSDVVSSAQITADSSLLLASASSIKYLINTNHNNIATTTDHEQFHEGLLHKCLLNPFDDDAFNSLFSIDGSSEDDRPSRPSSLDLYNPNQTPVAARKPRFNFSLAHNAYELNNLDPEVLDAPNLTYNLGGASDDHHVNSATDVECGGDNVPQEPASMPHISCTTNNPGFSYKNPAYQSAHPQCGAETATTTTVVMPSEEDVRGSKVVDDGGNMKKWKGVVFDEPEDEEDDEKSDSQTIITMEAEYEVSSLITGVSRV